MKYFIFISSLALLLIMNPPFPLLSDFFLILHKNPHFVLFFFTYFLLFSVSFLMPFLLSWYLKTSVFLLGSELLNWILSIMDTINTINHKYMRKFPPSVALRTFSNVLNKPVRLKFKIIGAFKTDILMFFIILDQGYSISNMLFVSKSV